MILYHGSNIEIEKVNLDKCMPFKDFGKGFYTSTLHEQAMRMAQRTVRIKKAGSPCVTVFFIDDKVFSDIDLKIKQFNNPDKEWARFVINNRDRNFKKQGQDFGDKINNDCNIGAKFDIVIGPVANDDIVALMDVFLAGLISDDALARELTFRELNNQISFHTEKSIAYLQKIEACHG